MNSKHIDELLEFCKIPSVSDDAEACDEAVEFLLDAMKQRGISVEVISHDGNDVIYGELEGSSQNSILYYSHYDVVPAEDLQDWNYPRLTLKFLMDTFGDAELQITKVPSSLAFRHSIYLVHMTANQRSPSSS